MLNLLNYSHYNSTVQAAHGLADLLKRRRPKQREQVDQLQALVTRTHGRLGELQREMEAVECVTRRDGRYDPKRPCFEELCGQIAGELNVLMAAHQALDDLRRAAPTPEATPRESKRAERFTS